MTPSAKNVSAAIAISDGSILITRRAAGEKLAGLWEFPGGKQEPGESIHQCLEREILEELCVRARVGDIFAESLYKYAGGTINLVAILIELDSTDFSLSVHDAARWVKIESLLNYELAPADIPIAERIVQIYGGT